MHLSTSPLALASALAAASDKQGVDSDVKELLQDPWDEGGEDRADEGEDLGDDSGDTRFEKTSSGRVPNNFCSWGSRMPVASQTGGIGTSVARTNDHMQ